MGTVERVCGNTVEISENSGNQRVDARKMRVLDPEASADERAKIQHTMQGAGVLDVRP